VVQIPANPISFVHAPACLQGLELEPLEARYVPSLIPFASFGAVPVGSLLEDSSGNFFGTTTSGGASNDGTVFELPHDSGTINALASFSRGTGIAPHGGVIEDAAGNFFGTTTSGGASNGGTVFELPHGSSTNTALASFSSSTGVVPQAGVIDGPVQRGKHSRRHHDRNSAGRDNSRPRQDLAGLEGIKQSGHDASGSKLRLCRRINGGSELSASDSVIADLVSLRCVNSF